MAKKEKAKVTLIAEAYGEGVKVELEGYGSKMQLLEMYSGVTNVLVQAGVKTDDLILAGSMAMANAKRK